MTTLKRLLLIDDDPTVRELLAEQLAQESDFVVIAAATATDGRRIAAEQVIDLVLLDVGLPDGDGREVCKALRAAGFKAPVIMLTAADSEADTILGLDSGANDYITKPFRIGVLLARVRAQLRQHELSDDAVFAIGPYKFRPSAKLLNDAERNRRIRLTEKETAILKYLYRIGGRVVGRDVLLNEVWGYNAGVTTHTLETHVYRLRQKIERDPAKAEILITEPGGYRLNP